MPRADARRPPPIDDVTAFDALLRQDLSSFVAKTFATVSPGVRYLPNWHIDLICAHLAAASEGRIKRLIINMPPRYMKSIAVSVAWPAWLLGRRPQSKVIAASYSAALALKHSLDCRHVVQSNWYRRVFPAVDLAADQNQKHRFTTTRRGFRLATSIGGTVTGEGGDVLIVDDPHDPRRANSARLRQAALDWFDQTFSSRLDDKRRGVIVVVMQRLHESDLTGHLLEKGGWTHLCLPAEAEAAETVAFGPVRVERAPGDLLHPAREGREEIARTKRELGAQAFAAQYQQRPAPAEGGLVKIDWLRRFDDAPAADRCRRVVQSWDTAFKGGAHNDPSVCLTFAEVEEGYLLVDLWRGRVGYPALKRAALAMADKHRPHAILIEDKASGQSLLQDLRAEGALPVVAIRPERDKVSRLAGVTALIEAGRLHVPRAAPWLAAFEAELLTFPNSAHDDQVDALSQFLNWAHRQATSARRMRLKGL